MIGTCCLGVYGTKVMPSKNDVDSGIRSQPFALKSEGDGEGERVSGALFNKEARVVSRQGERGSGAGDFFTSSGHRFCQTAGIAWYNLARVERDVAVIWYWRLSSLDSPSPPGSWPCFRFSLYDAESALGQAA